MAEMAGLICRDAETRSGPKGSVDRSTDSVAVSSALCVAYGAALAQKAVAQRGFKAGDG